MERWPTAALTLLPLILAAALGGSTEIRRQHPPPGVAWDAGSRTLSAAASGGPCSSRVGGVTWPEGPSCEELDLQPERCAQLVQETLACLNAKLADLQRSLEVACSGCSKLESCISVDDFCSDPVLVLADDRCDTDGCADDPACDEDGGPGCP